MPLSGGNGLPPPLRGGDGGGGEKTKRKAVSSTSTSTTFGWICPRCTFGHHLVPSARCAMCGFLRIDDPMLRSHFDPSSTLATSREGEPDRGGVVGGGGGGNGRCGVVATSSSTNDDGYGYGAGKSMSPLTNGGRRKVNPLHSERGAAVDPPLAATATTSTSTSPPASSGAVPPAAVVRRNNPYAKTNNNNNNKPQQQQQLGGEGPLPLTTTTTTTATPASSAAAAAAPATGPVMGEEKHAKPAGSDNSCQAIHRSHPDDNDNSNNAFGRMMKAAASAKATAAAGSAGSGPVPAALRGIEGGGGRAAPQARQQQQPRQQPQKMPPPTSSTSSSSSMTSSCYTYRPGPVPLDLKAAEHWCYPASNQYETRQYQVEMTEASLFHNTLVSLPTGLGKTLVAATVLYNFHVWYPTGTVVFCAPTLPLVHQQVQACGQVWQHHMDPSVTAVLTGQMSPSQRQTLWSNKRIIFATPQTVHNDLEQGTLSNPTNIVLLVLDEAHKATGQYSYVRIVQLLDQKGAKYRIVGLSATPGANIKAIQKVVDALRITRIDARAEDDPTVAPYTHQRTSEIVIVKQTSSAQRVEQAITALLGPFVDAIRKAVSSSPCDNGLGLSRRLMGNATLTSFQILKAKEDLATHDPALLQRLQGHFHVAHAFVGLRDNVHKHGIGMVRTKLQAMKNDRPRGLMATVLKDEPFQRLCEAVSIAMNDGSTGREGGSGWDGARINNNLSISVQDRLASNPKLSKLCEILTEHFERARATAATARDASGEGVEGGGSVTTATTTRAIVFSQFRESVSEIVQVLKCREPLIRPRHFIGQGNGSKSAADAGAIDGDGSAAGTNGQSRGGVAVLKGMKQSEQHEVIRDFRHGIYNTLVCTCIGEEGLDIGEVDLIVNFDMLRSPIRMIQRVGRTGRQRQGRVVCLVSEGPEQRTLQASRQSERNLIHALRNPRAFQCHPTVAMFPVPPVRKDVSMSMSQRFHASQVEGHSTAKGLASKKERLPKTTFAIPKPATWRLTDEEDKIRRRCFGDAADVHVPFDLAGGFPAALRRHFLSVLETVSSTPRLEGPSQTYGRSVRLLRRMQSSQSTFTGSLRPPKSSLRPSRIARLRGGESAICRLFPTTASVGSSSASIGDAYAAASLDDGKRETAEPAPSPRRSGQACVDEAECLASLLNGTKAQYDAPVQPHVQPSAQNHDEPHLAHIAQQDELVEAPPVPAARIQDELQLEWTTQSMVGQSCVREPPSPRAQKQVQLHVLRSDLTLEDDVFVLPTPPDDDSSDSEDERPSGEEQNSRAQPGARSQVDIATVPSIDDFRLPSQDSVSLPDTPVPPAVYNISALDGAPVNTSFVAMQDDFRLPSDDDDDSSTSSSSLEDAAPAVSKCQPSGLQRREVEDVEDGAEHGEESRPRNLMRLSEGSSHELRIQDASQDDDDELRTYRTKSRKPNRLVMCDNTQGTPFDRNDGVDDHSASLKSSLQLSMPSRKPESSRLEDTPVSLPMCGNLSTNPTSAAPSRGAGVLEDTPLVGAAGRSAASTLRSVGALTDTPAAELTTAMSTTSRDVETSADDIVCCVCQSGSSPDHDPILLCDGPADGFPCSVAVHLSCYAIPRDALFQDEWRCDPCAYYYLGGGARRVSCYVCRRDEAVGVMKRMETDVWKHARCGNANISLGRSAAAPQEPVVGKGRLRKMGDPADEPVEPVRVDGKKRSHRSEDFKDHRRPLVELPLNERPAEEDACGSSSPESPRRNKRRRKVRHPKYSRFLDLEAAIHSDDDVEGDEEEDDDLEAIEAEEDEHMKSFINDSSQLGGCTQDELDRADPDAGRDSGVPHDPHSTALHRQLDMDEERRLALATPALNRRLRRQHQRKNHRESTSTAQSAPTPASSAPGSEKGLGNLHFIRSVLEHHRLGGDANDVEAVYKRLERQGRRRRRRQGAEGDDEHDEHDDDVDLDDDPDDDDDAMDEDDDDDEEEEEDEAFAARPRRPGPVLAVAVPYEADSSDGDNSDDE